MRTTILACLFAAACGGSSPPAQTTTTTTTTTTTATPPEPASASAMTAEQCTAAGGEVVGDIGDGAIHRPEYRCTKSGQPPIGHIAAEPGGPAAIEGAVCCK